MNQIEFINTLWLVSLGLGGFIIYFFTLSEVYVEGSKASKVGHLLTHGTGQVWCGLQIAIIAFLFSDFAWEWIGFGTVGISKEVSLSLMKLQALRLCFIFVVAMVLFLVVKISIKGKTFIHELLMTTIAGAIVYLLTLFVICLGLTFFKFIDILFISIEKGMGA